MHNTEISPMTPSEIQQIRQLRIFRQGAEIIRNPRITAKIEAAQTSNLTIPESAILGAILQQREQQRLQRIAKNFEVRQRALVMEVL